MCVMEQPDRSKFTGESRCDNCEKVWPDEELDQVKNLEQRLDPGGIVPSGECPACGCLCYPVPRSRGE